MSQEEYMEYCRACPYDAMGDFSVFHENSEKKEDEREESRVAEFSGK